MPFVRLKLRPFTLLPKLLLAFAVVLLPILSMLVVDYQRDTEAEIRQVAEEQRRTATAVALQVEEFFAAAEGVGRAVALAPATQAMDGEALYPYLARLIKAQPRFAGIAVFDATGEMIAMSDPPGRHFNASRLPNFAKLMQGQSGIAYRGRLPAINGTLGVSAEVPVMTPDQRVIGFVGVLMVPAHLAEHYLASLINPDEAIFLANPSGDLVFHTGLGALTVEKNGVYAGLPAMRAAAAGQAGIEADLHDPVSGDPRIAAFVPTPKYHWVVGVSTPRAAVVGGIRRVLVNQLVVFGCVLLISVSLALALARHLVLPLQRLAKRARSLADGQLPAPVQVSTRDEVRQLADAFNNMAATLHAREAERSGLLDRERRARVEAERLGRIRDEFLVTLSHELKTPLTAILGWTELILSGMLNGEATQKALDTILRNARAEANLVDDLLDVSKSVQGELGLDFQPLAVGPVLAAAVESVRMTARAKSLELVVPAFLDEPGELHVLGEQRRLLQIFWNLLTNAVKFTPMGGRVEVSLQRRGGYAEIRVSDSGVGMSEAFLPHAFERFRQEDGSTTRRAGGLGIGLAIVKQLVEAHGGTVLASSPGPGRGTTVCVRLPLQTRTVGAEGGADERWPPYGAATTPTVVGASPNVTGSV